MIRGVFLSLLGVSLALLGLVGLVVPLMPGVVFLALAACCFAALSPRFQARLERHPGWRGFNRRWTASRHLPVLHRAKLAFWLSAEAAVKLVRRR
ncbi:MAG: DUF454 family protein [Pseudomonadales bacterium]